MIIKDAAYVGSFPSEAKCPQDERPEFAFIGRSNVGKSSLINMICGRKKLAYISNKPRKSQSLNFYLINESWYIADLPGYGYAKISKKKRSEWERMTQGYLVKRQTLQCAFVLIDANVPPQANDIEFINWLGEQRIPFVIAYTKLDKVKEKHRDRNIEAIQQALLEHWHELPGREEILAFIEEVNAKTLGE